MRIPVFAASANPRTCAPLYWLKPSRFEALLGLGRLLRIPEGAQHKADTPKFASQPGEHFNFAPINNRRNWSWKKVDSGFTPVMQFVP